MRRTLTVALATLALMGLTPASESGMDPTSVATVPEVRTVNIIGACTSPNPRVAPPSITVNGADEVHWRDPSGQANSFTVEPKQPGSWPFATPRSAADRGEVANSGRPQGRTIGGEPVQQGQVYAYKITIVCPGGGVQIIDPDIIIGEM